MAALNGNATWPQKAVYFAHHVPNCLWRCPPGFSAGAPVFHAMDAGCPTPVVYGWPGCRQREWGERPVARNGPRRMDGSGGLHAPNGWLCQPPARDSGHHRAAHRRGGHAGLLRRLVAEPLHQGRHRCDEGLGIQLGSPADALQPVHLAHRGRARAGREYVAGDRI